MEKNSGGKNKSNDSALADTSSGKQSSSTQQISFVHPKKDQNHRGAPWRGRGRGQDSLVTGVNVIPKKEEGDLSQVDYFHCKKKGHYAIRCPQKKKQELKNSIGHSNLHVNDCC